MPINDIVQCLWHQYSFQLGNLQATIGSLTKAVEKLHKDKDQESDLVPPTAEPYRTEYKKVQEVHKAPPEEKGEWLLR